MKTLSRYLLQAILYGAFIAVIGFFSSDVSYTRLSEQQATIKLTLNHAGVRIGKCRKLSQQEQDQLAPNMRVREVCPRERSPVTLELLLAGKSIYYDTLIPHGLQHDGVSSAYQRFTVPAGEHKLLARLNDNIHVKGFTYTHEAIITLKPRQVLVVDFNKQAGGFVFY